MLLANSETYSNTCSKPLALRPEEPQAFWCGGLQDGTECVLKSWCKKRLAWTIAAMMWGYTLGQKVDAELCNGCVVFALGPWGAKKTKAFSFYEQTQHQSNMSNQQFQVFTLRMQGLAMPKSTHWWPEPLATHPLDTLGCDGNAATAMWQVW